MQSNSYIIDQWFGRYEVIMIAVRSGAVSGSCGEKKARGYLAEFSVFSVRKRVFCGFQ